MNKKLIFSAAALLLTAACSNDDNNPSGDGNAAKGIEFKVNFADYNAEQEAGVTRAGHSEAPLEQQTVDLGNGVLAQCTLQRDTTRQPRAAATRALPADTYTMLVYDAATHAYVTGVTGTVTGSYFSPTSLSKAIVPAGTYDFVLFNSKVTRSGNNLTVTRANAADALIARTQQVVTATPQRQYVTFNMKHVGARVKIKLTGYMDIPAVSATLTSVNATDVPASSVYDASTGTWTAGAGAAMTAATTYPASTEPKFTSVTYTTKSNEDVAFMPSTDVSKLKLTFNSGTIYLQNMANAGLTFKPATTLKLDANGAYVLNVKLMYTFLYLMSDGTTDFINSTQYTTLRQSDGVTKRYIDKNGNTLTTPKIPIAVVLSQSHHMAIALNNANNGGMIDWCDNASHYVGANTHATTSNNDALNSQATSGKDETWDASYSTGTIGVKATNSVFTAFYAAANYNPGVSYTGSPALKWYLPSYSDFKWMFSALSFGDKANITHDGAFGWYGRLADIAFTQVGGTVITGKYLWSSTQLTNVSYVCTVCPASSGTIYWTYNQKGTANLWVRPFVEY